MAKITDLRNVGRPTMTLVFNDGETDVTVHVCAPTVELIDELRGSSETLFAALKGEDGDSRTKRAVYELAAKLINCNTDLFTTTADELATRYGLSLEALQVFYLDYVEFINAIQNEKN